MSEVDGLHKNVGIDIRTFVEENYAYMRPDLKIGDDDDLLDLGLIDSLGFVELVEEVQTRYGVRVEDVEITEDNFGSLNAMVAFIGRKLTH